MTDDLNKIVAGGVSAGDQWLALKRDTVQSMPDDVLGGAFWDVCRACEIYADTDESMSLRYMSAIVVRCELHAEIIRRLDGGISSIAKIEGREP